MDFKKARFYMVEQQIRPWDVLNFDLLDALLEIPRERFVVESCRELAYIDEKLPLANGGLMLEPRVAAKMIQALSLQKTDKVLEVGTGSGYSTAVMSKLAQHVLTADIDQEQQNLAREALAACEIGNVSFANADGLNGVAEQAPYDAILIGGSVAGISTELKEQLSDKGRLVAVTNNTFPMKAVLITREGSHFNEVTLFETEAPALVNQSTTTTFTF